MIHVIQVFQNLIRRARQRRKGQTLVEYALIIAVLAVVMIAAFSLLGSRIVIIFSAMTEVLDTAQVPTAH